MATTVVNVPVPKTTLPGPKTPLAAPKTLLAIPKISPITPKPPLAGTKTPLAVPKTPLAVPKTSVAVPKSTLAVPKTPLATPKTSVAVPKTPLVQPKTPLVLPKLPLVQPKSPLALPKTSLAVPKSNTALTVQKNAFVSPKTTLGVKKSSTTPKKSAHKALLALPSPKVTGAVPNKLFKSHSNCFICYKTFENSSLAATNEFEVPLQLKLFEVYSQLLNLQNVKWNLKSDGYPFCPSCVLEINSLVDLRDQILSLQKSIDVILKSTQCSILISRSTIKNPRLAKNLKKIDYLRNLAVKEFEPTVRLLRWGEPVVIKLNPNAIAQDIPLATPLIPQKGKGGKLVVKTEPTEGILTGKNKRKLIINKEEVGHVTGVENPQIRTPRKLSSSARVIVPKSMSKDALTKSESLSNVQENEVETIDLSSDDEEADPDFSASEDSEDQYELGSEKSWGEGSAASSSNIDDGIPIRRSSRTKRKSIKMIEADNDKSQGDVTSSQSHQTSKRVKLSHQGEKYKCGDCASSYSSKKLLSKHMNFTNHRPYDVSKDSNEENRSNMDSDPDEEESLIDRKVEDFPFECKKCWTRHATISKLRRHERDHFGKESYKCTLGNCQLSFTETLLLDDHVRKVHENEDEQRLLAFMDSSQEKRNHLDIDFSFLEEPPLRNLPSPTPEESFRIIEDDPMFRLDIDEPIIIPEEHEPMSFESINYQDNTLIDYSDGNFNFFDPLTQPQGIYYM